MGELKRKASQYTDAFSGPSPLADEDNRARKAAKIRAVLAEEGVFDAAAVRVLDIGCSYGIILRSLTPADGFGVGLDLDVNLGTTANDVAFVRGDAERLPFADRSFDAIVCNHVYEHTDDPDALISEIERVLADTGVCYFAGPNKYELIEPHYGLPFLSWLPRGLADIYMRLTRKGASYPEKPYSMTDLANLIRRFEVTSYTEKILNDPVHYHATDILPPRSIKRFVALRVYRYLPFFFPGFVYILKKKTN
ncbi:MAG: class I SAM-dependent methyltransferase [Gammaproteobacteria bacterium]|jgi:SAM-dependent methyltransferase